MVLKAQEPHKTELDGQELDMSSCAFHLPHTVHCHPFTIQVWDEIERHRKAFLMLAVLGPVILLQQLKGEFGSVVHCTG